VQIEWLVLADSAQIVGNKLYLLGGGWDVLTVGSALPVQQRCAVAASYRVPWNETNERHTVDIEVADEDGQVLARVSGQVEVGRPAGIPPGTDQRAQIAAELVLNLEKAGSFAVIARIEGAEVQRTPFRVVLPAQNS
jgi:hypothetical protein